MEGMTIRQYAEGIQRGKMLVDAARQLMPASAITAPLLNAMNEPLSAAIADGVPVVRFVCGTMTRHLVVADGVWEDGPGPDGAVVVAWVAASGPVDESIKKPYASEAVGG